LPIFDSTGVNLHYEVEGSGQPVVLLHGLASNIEQNWRRPGVINALVNAGFRTVALDVRGHGRSDKPYESGAYDGTRMGDDVIALMDHLRIDVADLAGYSMGGAIAASLLARRPERLRRVIIAGAGDSVLGVDAGIPRRIPMRGRISGSGFAALAAIRNAERAPIHADKLAEVTCPVMILVGSGDRVAGAARRLAAAIPRATIVRVPGNHFSAVAHPAFRQAMIEFLSS
jgi:pimeloyl-ACP methyl ester carboxylesterase